jgi:predicted metal-dependent peptidase
MLIPREERWYLKLETMHISGRHPFEVVEGLVLEESYHPALSDLSKSWKDEKWFTDWNYLNAWQVFMMCSMYHN